MKKKTKQVIDKILLKFGLKRIQKDKGECIKYSHIKPKKLTFQFRFEKQIGYRTYMGRNAYINMVENQSMEELMDAVKPYVSKEVTDDYVRLEIWVGRK